MKSSNRWFFLAPYKAYYLNTVRTRHNYYLFISNHKKRLMFQYSGGRYRYSKIKQRFTVSIIQKVYLLSCEFILRTNQLNYLIFRITNMKHSLFKVIIKYLLKKKYYNLMGRRTKQISYNGCKWTIPARE